MSRKTAKLARKMLTKPAKKGTPPVIVLSSKSKSKELTAKAAQAKPAKEKAVRTAKPVKVDPKIQKEVDKVNKVFNQTVAQARKFGAPVTDQMMASPEFHAGVSIGYAGTTIRFMPDGKFDVFNFVDGTDIGLTGDLKKAVKMAVAHELKLAQAKAEAQAKVAAEAKTIKPKATRKAVKTVKAVKSSKPKAQRKPAKVSKPKAQRRK